MWCCKVKADEDIGIGWPDVTSFKKDACDTTPVTPQLFESNASTKLSALCFFVEGENVMS